MLKFQKMLYAFNRLKLIRNKQIGFLLIACFIAFQTNCSTNSDDKGLTLLPADNGSDDSTVIESIEPGVIGSNGYICSGQLDPEKVVELIGQIDLLPNVDCDTCHVAHHREFSDLSSSDHDDGFYEEPARCFECHGNNGGGGISEISCNACHDSEAQWLTAGHSDATSESFTYWDEDVPPEIPASCAKCHSATGLPVFLAEGSIEDAQPTSQGLECSTCHTGTDYLTGSAPRIDVASVEFPGGAVVAQDADNADSLICANCHSGRNSGITIETYITGRDDYTPGFEDAPLAGAGFQNAHYAPAAAMQQGTVVGLLSEYGGSYSGVDMHYANGPATQCAYCHGNDHTFDVANKLGDCSGCHTTTSVEALQMDTTDYDSDVATTTSSATVDAFGARLLLAMTQYASENGLGTLSYGSSYPYFSLTGGLGWSARLLRAAHNYQVYVKEHGAWAHNHKYMLQGLYDSINDLNAATSTDWLTTATVLVRPAP